MLRNEFFTKLCKEIFVCFISLASLGGLILIFFDILDFDTTNVILSQKRRLKMAKITKAKKKKINANEKYFAM